MISIIWRYLQSKQLKQLVGKARQVNSIARTAFKTQFNAAEDTQLCSVLTAKTFVARDASLDAAIGRDFDAWVLMCNMDAVEGHVLPYSRGIDGSTEFTNDTRIYQ